MVLNTSSFVSNCIKIYGESIVREKKERICRRKVFGDLKSYSDLTCEELDEELEGCTIGVDCHLDYKKLYEYKVKDYKQSNLHRPLFSTFNEFFFMYQQDMLKEYIDRDCGGKE